LPTHHATSRRLSILLPRLPQFSCRHTSTTHLSHQLQHQITTFYIHNGRRQGYDVAHLSLMGWDEF
jgi:hypothetical protein